MKPIAKIASVIAIMSTSGVVSSAPPLDVSGHNDFGEHITVYGQYDDQDWFGTILVKSKDGQETLLRKQNCTSGETFSCSSEGTSPLAGTVYRFLSYSSEDCGRIAVCKSGCSQRAPREVLEAGYECYDDGLCPNVARNRHGPWTHKYTSGSIRGTKVNLRDYPHSQSRILRTVDHGAEIRAIDSDISCRKISGKLGIWVFVEVFDGFQPSRGWLFDAYIDFQR